MPVRKFRDVSEMESVLWREPGTAELYRAIARVWSFAARTCRLRFPAGVYRHRSIDDAQLCREAWEAENFRRFQERRTARNLNGGSGSSPGRA